MELLTIINISKEHNQSIFNWLGSLRHKLLQPIQYLEKEYHVKVTEGFQSKQTLFANAYVFNHRRGYREED